MTIAVRNPRTGEFDAHIEPPSQAELDALARRLREGHARWREAGLGARIGAMQDWGRALLANKPAVIDALAHDTGRMAETVLEFDAIVSAVDRWCRIAPDLLAVGERASSIPFIRIREAVAPYSLVGVISPWNFPLLLSLIDAIPALLAGCAVVVKPSEITPRFVAPLQATIDETPLLRDAFAYVCGAGETGAQLVELVDLVCFTGSVTTGRKVGEACARRFIPCFLELGGKDPAIVLDGADIERASAALLWGSVVNEGQSCLSIERIYVARGVFDAFVARLTERARAIKFAYPAMSDGQLGPIIATRQAPVIQAHLDDAIQRGAVVRCGGHIVNLGGGLYCEPTVLTNVSHDMKVMCEETFGPIMPVMAFETVDEAIALANDTMYGLSASVFAATQDEAVAVALRLHAGAVSINDACLTAMMHEGEKQAFKFSGMGGTRMGPSAIKRFTRKQALLVNTSAAPDPWWFR